MEEGGIDGLEPRHKGSQPKAATAAVQARVARRVQQKPPDGSTHWSCRKLAADLGMSHATVQRILAQAKTATSSSGPVHGEQRSGFLKKKAADIIGLYMNPPQHAAVFCVDEKTAIQALDRQVPVLSPFARTRRTAWFRILQARHAVVIRSSGREDREGGRQDHARRHTSADFIEFLTDIVGRTRWAKEIHIVLDNLSAHKTPAVQEFLEQKIRACTFTSRRRTHPGSIKWSCGSPKIQRDVIDRGIFTSVADLSRKIRKYIQAYAKSAKPFRWTYTHPKRRITVSQ